MRQLLILYVKTDFCYAFQQSGANSLHTTIWVSALMRRAQAAAGFAVLAHKGDAERGDVLIRVRDRDSNIALWGREWSLEGRDAWQGYARLPPELIGGQNDAAADAYVSRRLKADPDLWVLDLEDVDIARLLGEN